MLNPNAQKEVAVNRDVLGDSSSHRNMRSLGGKPEYQTSRTYKSRNSFEFSGEENELASYDNYGQGGQRSAYRNDREQYDSRYYMGRGSDSKKEYAQELFEDVNSTFDRLNAIDRALEEKSRRSPNSGSKYRSIQSRISRRESETEQRSNKKLQDADYFEYISHIVSNRAKNNSKNNIQSPKREQTKYSAVRSYEQEAKPRTNKWSSNPALNKEHISPKAATMQNYQQGYREQLKTPENNRKFEIDYSSIFQHKKVQQRPANNNYMLTFGSAHKNEHDSDDMHQEDVQGGVGDQEDYEDEEDPNRYEQDYNEENGAEDEEFYEENENIEDHYAFDPEGDYGNNQYEQIRYHHSGKKSNRETEQDSEDEYNAQKNYHSKSQSYKQQSNSSREEVSQPPLTYFQIHGRTPKKVQEDKVPETKSANKYAASVREETRSNSIQSLSALKKPPMGPNSKINKFADEEMSSIDQREFISLRNTRTSGFFDSTQRSSTQEDEIPNSMGNLTKSAEKAAIVGHQKPKSSQVSANNTSTNFFSGGNVNASQNSFRPLESQNSLRPLESQNDLNNVSQSQYLQSSGIQVSPQHSNAFAQMAGLQSPSGSALQQSGYYPEVSNQQLLFQQTFGQNPLAQSYPQFFGPGMNNMSHPQFMMPPPMNYPFQVPANPNMFQSMMMNPNQMPPPYGLYRQDAFNKWNLPQESNPQSQTTIKTNRVNKPEPNDNKLNKDDENDVVENKFEEADGIKDILKEQEEFLRKLDEEKKQRREKIERERLQSAEQMRLKASKNTEQQAKTETTKAPLLSQEENSSGEKKRKELAQLKEELWKGTKVTELQSERSKKPEFEVEKNIYKESPRRIEAKVQYDEFAKNKYPAEETKKAWAEPAAEKHNKWKNDIKSSPQLQANPIVDNKQTNNEIDSLEALSDKEEEVSTSQDQKPLPKSEAFEILWDQPNESDDKLLKRKKSLAERLDHSKTSKKEKGPEKTKEELFALRKQMMEYKGHSREKSTNKEKNGDRSFTKATTANVSVDNIDMDLRRPSSPLAFEVNDYKRKRSREPNAALLERLAGGKKTKVSKDEMIKLSNRRYEMLPEIQKKKDEDRKKEEQRTRKEKVKELEQKIRESNQRNLSPQFRY